MSSRAFVLLQLLGATSVQFFIRTPEPVENGLRSILKIGSQNLRVTKRRFMLGDSGLSDGVAPDVSEDEFENTVGGGLTGLLKGYPLAK